MRITLERLRIGLLVGASLLVLVIAAFFGYARYKVHRALVNLPGRMGATITKEFNGWTFSQSDGKKTIFTIHASKAVEHTNGMLTLHDVSMILYGKKGDRADRISGDEFEYDTKDEVIRALGIVHLDLEAPVAEGTRTSVAAKHLDPAADSKAGQEDAGVGSRVIHIKTSGLVYMKKLGVAATAQGIEFAFGGFTGHAVGAEYDSDTGHVVLQSALAMSGLDKGKPIAMAASHGELDRVGNVAEFADAHYSSAGETAQAETAKIHLRNDGTVERIEGERRVVLEGAGQGSVTSDRADVVLDATSKPKTAVLAGNVHFTDDEALRQARGDSERANIEFDGQGHIQHVVLQGHVRTSEVVRRIEGGTGVTSQRDLTADSLELSLVTEGKAGKPQLRDAKATGSAHLKTVGTTFKPSSASICRNLPVSSGRCSMTTTNKFSGDSIQAQFIAPHGDAELSTVHGTGHTVVEQLSSGKDQIIYGDTLDASFREAPGAVSKAANPAKQEVELASAVQQGGVAITRSLPGKSKGGAPAPPDVQHATARQASYDADAGTITLTGDVRMSGTGSTLTADRVVMERDSGNATADGGIKATYLQTGSQQACAKTSGSAEPVHILASRAEFDHDDGRATFYGRAAAGGLGSNFGLARLWQARVAGQGSGQDTQGGSQIEAPVLIFEKEGDRGRLTARAERAGVIGQVHAALAYVEKAEPSDASGRHADKGSAKPTANGEPMPSRQGVARITSSQMVYSDADRQAVLTGGVHLLDRNGDMRAQQATIFLTSAPVTKDTASNKNNAAMNSADRATSGAPCLSGTSSNGPGAGGTDANGAGELAGASGILGGNVDRIVATQHVEITEPGRKATGERLVYTASDQVFVLTGTAAAPPKVVDATQGTTTGAMLRFHSGDDSVVVSGSDGDAPTRKVHTETRVKQK